MVRRGRLSAGLRREVSRRHVLAAPHGVSGLVLASAPHRTGAAPRTVCDMRSMHKSSTFRPSPSSLAATMLLLSCIGCEALLGADFGDYGRAFDTDGAAHDTGAAEGATGGAGGASTGSGGAGGIGGTGTAGTSSGGSTGTGGSTGGAGGASTGVGGTSSGGSTGTGGASRGGNAGTAGGAGTAGSDGGTGVPPGDASAVDVTLDRRVDDAARDAGTGGGATDGGPPPPRDGGTTGGMCTPGEVHSIATCGNCGLFLQICNTQGVWDPPFCQQDPSACMPGSTDLRACASGGTQLATCTSSCIWSLGPCVPAACTVGQMDVQPCSFCGTQTRTCQTTEGGAAWGPFAACANQGVCPAGTSEVATCGRCGTRSRVCNTACAWDAWGVCGGEGECAPASTETRNCEILLPIIVLGKQTRTCDDSCNWGAYSTCK